MKILLVRLPLFILCVVTRVVLADATPEKPPTLTGVKTTSSPPSSIQAESPWRLGIALGYGLRRNPLVQSDDIPVVVDIDIAWFGERFFFDNGDLGLTFADNALLTANLVARVNSDRVFFGKTDTRFVSIGAAGEALDTVARVEVPDRDYAVEVGVEILADGPWGHLQAGAHHDVSGTHRGYEVDLEYGYGWRNQRWFLEPSVGIAYKSADLNSYYWGVRPEEASVALPEYDAGSGINLRSRLLFSYQMTRQWAFSLVAQYERLNDDAAQSPIVENRDVFGYFAGFSYRYR